MSETKVMLKNVRFSYAHVFEPTAAEDGGEKKYNISIIIPKDDKVNIKIAKAGIEAAKQEGLATKWNGKLPKKYEEPLKDGDKEKEDDPAYSGCLYLNAKSKKKPGIIDRNKQEIVDDDEFYSGCYGFVTLNFFPYDKGTGGVAAGLGNIMKTKDGERLGGGGVSASTDFAEVEVDDNDDL